MTPQLQAVVASRGYRRPSSENLPCSFRNAASFRFMWFVFIDWFSYFDVGSQFDPQIRAGD